MFINISLSLMLVSYWYLFTQIEFGYEIIFNSIAKTRTKQDYFALNIRIDKYCENAKFMYEVSRKRHISTGSVPKSV